MNASARRVSPRCRRCSAGSRKRPRGPSGRRSSDDSARWPVGAQAHDPLDAEPEEEAFDAQGYEETWNDALRLQETGQEPLAFSGIGVPVLMLHGEDDPHPGESIHATLQTCVSGVELTLLERCGHEPWRERHAREPFLDLLRDRLRRLTEA